MSLLSDSDEDCFNGDASRERQFDAKISKNNDENEDTKTVTKKKINTKTLYEIGMASSHRTENDWNSALSSRCVYRLATGRKVSRRVRRSFFV